MRSKEDGLVLMDRPQIADSIPRADVLGVGISAVTMNDAVSQTLRLVERGDRGYVCVTGVHGVMEAQRDREFRRILNQSFLTTPDGMPMVWIGQRQGFQMERVYGPDFMLALCRAGVQCGLRHFLYGGNEGVAEDLRQALQRKVPGVNVVGTFTPPFRPLMPNENSELMEQVRAVSPDVIWVGLSTPKQERFMAEYTGALNVPVMVGVGAAFDIHTGRIADAPKWMKQSGLQWFHRLVQEPSRLWRRYLVNNIGFILALALNSGRPLRDDHR